MVFMKIYCKYKIKCLFVLGSATHGLNHDVVVDLSLMQNYMKIFIYLVISFW